MQNFDVLCNLYPRFKGIYESYIENKTKSKNKYMCIYVKRYWYVRLLYFISNCLWNILKYVSYIYDDNVDIYLVYEVELRKFFKILDE